MLLASEISCSRSKVLVPVSAWSSPAESVSRSRCASAISDIVCSYSARSSSRRSPRASRIFSVSWAERAGRVGSTALAAPVVAAPPALAGAGLVAALLATFAAVDADRLVVAAFFGALLLSALPSGLVAGFAVALAALGRLAAGALFAGFAGFVGGAVRAFVAPVLPVAVLAAVAVLAFSPSPAFADAVFEAPAFAAAVFAVAG